MKKLSKIIFLLLLPMYSFAFTLLQVDMPAPPLPDDLLRISGNEGEPSDTPIDFIIPFLLIASIALILFIIKNKYIVKEKKIN